MPRGSTLAEVPVTRGYPNLRFGFLWSRGWESNPLQPSNPGCLLRVATRCFCSPSPEPIGLRWTSQPRPRPPGDSDRTCQNRISLLKNQRRPDPDYQSISFQTSLATCLAASSVRTFPISSLPVLKTDTL